jgi:SSS family solute:Na+ symporter
LVDLLLSGYMGVTQFFPMVVFGLFWKKSTKAAAFASLLVGEGLVFYLLILNKISVVAVPSLGGHVNTGFLALVINIAVFVVVSLLTNKSDDDVVRA